VIRLDAATVLLQWAVGGLGFAWVTTRHRQLSIGYGWLLRGTYGLIALAAAGIGVAFRPDVGRDIASILVVLAAGYAFAVSVRRRHAGVSGHNADHDRRSDRVAAMTGIDRQAPAEVDDSGTTEFPPQLDLIAPTIGVVGLIAAGLASGGNPALAVARLLIGAAFLGAVSDAMLLGHWYLVQPGMPRKYLGELVTWLIRLWPLEIALLLVPTGMFSVFAGTIDDGWNGMLAWMWAGCAVLTIGLSLVTKVVLKEREYSAVMAATGLLYLAILTAFGTDLVARAVLAG
jgi:hypothetical protein